MTDNAKFIWNELVTTDQEARGEFYSSLFGWTRNEMDMGPLGTYTIFQANGEDVAGMMDPATEFSRSRPAFGSPYIAVGNVRACAEGESRRAWRNHHRGARRHSERGAGLHFD